MANFSPVSRAEVSARLLEQIILKRRSRLHKESFSPGNRAGNFNLVERAEKTSCNRIKISARAEI